MMIKKYFLVLACFFLGGCWQSYLEEPFYHNASETAYPIRVKDNAFTGIPAMTGDLVGCALEVPFTPVYFILKDRYLDDQDSTQSLKATYGFLPRIMGRVFSTPFRIVKWALYDNWVYPGN
jgi:hypothetical protein